MDLGREVSLLRKRVENLENSLNLNRKLDMILEMLARILRMEAVQMATLDEILQSATEEETVIDSILVLLQQLAAETDPAKRQAIMDQITENKTKLVEALTANTPTPVTAISG